MLESNSSGDGVFGGSTVPETGCAFFSDCGPTLCSRKTQSEKLRGLGQSPSAARRPPFLLCWGIRSANRGKIAFARYPSPVGRSGLLGNDSVQFAHGISMDNDPVRVMNKPVANGFCDNDLAA